MTVLDLRNNVSKLMPGVHTILCEDCMAEYSCNANDYFGFLGNHIFMHCGKPMILARTSVTYKKVKL